MCGLRKTSRLRTGSAFEPMPAPPGVSWHCADQEQRREHYEHSHPLFSPLTRSPVSVAHGDDVPRATVWWPCAMPPSTTRERCKGGAGRVEHAPRPIAQGAYPRVSSCFFILSPDVHGVVSKLHGIPTSLQAWESLDRESDIHREINMPREMCGRSTPVVGRSWPWYSR